MEVICKPVGPVGANCYLVIEGSNVLVIDPGDEPGAIAQLLRALKLHLQGILLTHAHFDHIGAVDDLLRQFGSHVYVNKAEFDFLTQPEKNSSAHFMGIQPMVIQARPLELKEGLNKIGDFDVTAYYAPGHSVGSTILEIGDNLFTGDVLFQDSIGRTDLPTGDPAAMRDSLNFIKSLTKNYTVYPGHGPSTTLDEEKKHNPYLIYNLV